MRCKGARVSLRGSVFCVVVQYFLIVTITFSNNAAAQDTKSTGVDLVQAPKTDDNEKSSGGVENKVTLSDTKNTQDALSGIKEDSTKLDGFEKIGHLISEDMPEVKKNNSSDNSSVSLPSVEEDEHSNENKTSEKTPEEDFLPEEGAAEKEHSSSLAIFFVLFVMVLCIFLIHSILQYNCHYIPESLAIVFLGALVGLIMKLLPTEDFKKMESFSPTMFFLILLPPIIFESGYNLHKGKNKFTLVEYLIALRYIHECSAFLVCCNFMSFYFR